MAARSGTFAADRGGRLRLPDEYGSADFMQTYQACLAGQPIAVANGRRQAPRGKFKWLIDLYLSSPEWAGLGAGTRKSRMRILQEWSKQDYDVEDITRSVIADAVAARRGTPNAANHILNTLRPMFDWAVSAGHVDINPVVGIKRLKAPKTRPDEEDGHQTWSDEDLAKFEAAYPIGAFERRVYAVLLYTGLRIGDAARLGRQHVQKDGSIQISDGEEGRHRPSSDPPRTGGGARGRAARARGRACFHHRSERPQDRPGYPQGATGRALQRCGQGRRLEGPHRPRRPQGRRQTVRRGRRHGERTHGHLRLDRPGNGAQIHPRGGQEAPGGAGDRPATAGLERERLFPHLEKW